MLEDKPFTHNTVDIWFGLQKLLKQSEAVPYV